MYSGSEFQMEEAAAGKARLPTVESLTDSTMRPAMYVSSWEDTDSITSNEDIDTCTIEESRNWNFCMTDGGGASELQHKIV